jgi:hypothetical protein
MRRRPSFISFFFLIVVLINFTGIVIAQPSDAILKVRQRFLDADINTLTFHNIDEIFETRRVPAAGPVWEIPVKPAPLNFTYKYNEKTVPAEDFAERTYTNAILIIKDGKIVFERYLNQTNENTHFREVSKWRP